MRYPDIHGNTVVFTNEGDLWLGDLVSGKAHRLTSDAGVESNPAFSPDGRSIAFVGEYDGDRQAYVISVDGGVPRRLTNVSNFRIVAGWTPDGQNIVFRRSQSPTPYGYFTVPVSGGVPTKLPLEFASHVWMGQGGDFTFTRFNRWNMSWFRYIGGMQNQIWTSRHGKFSQITNIAGTNEYPVWIGHRIYFANEQNAKFRLMSVPEDGGTPKVELAESPVEIREFSTDGSKLIFERGTRVEIFDPATHVSTPLKLDLASDQIHTRERTIPAERNLGASSISPTGKRAFVESRGQILSLPVDEGEARVWKAKAGVRYRSPVMSPDAKSVAYFSDQSGEMQLYVAAADGSGEKAVTTDKARQLVKLTWAPNSKSILVYDSHMRLRLIDVATGTEKLVATTSQSWTQPPADFSPDSKWIAYVNVRPVTLFRSVFLYEVATGKSTEVSNGRSDDSNVAFSSDGQFLAVLTRRNLAVSDDPVLNQLDFGPLTIPVLLPLRKDVADPFVLKDVSEDAKPEKKEDKKPEFKIDLDGLYDRRIELPVGASNYGDIAMKGSKVYLVDGDTIRAFDIAAKALSEFAKGGQLTFSADNSKLFLATGPNMRVVDLASGAPKPVSFGRLRLTVNPTAEWKQIFWDAWRVLRDYFYVSNMHGLDWKAIGDKYSAFLPSVRSRDELDELIRWMQAEIGSSHQYLDPGDNQDSKARISSASLGVDLVADVSGYYRISHIVRGDGYRTADRSPLLGPGKDVREGMYIVSVAGAPVRVGDDPYASLVGRAGQIVSVEVNDKPTSVGAKTILVRTLGDENRMRYLEWVESNRKYVEKISNGRVGYIHVGAMEPGDMQDFVKQYFAQRDKEAILFDDRFNNGGYVQEYINKILGSRLSGFFNMRDSALPWTRQGDYFMGPMACLINEFDISCGEEFPYRFKQLKLGPLVGRRTMGGEVGSDPGWPMVDGGAVFVPNYGFWNPEKGWQIEGRGVEPDIDVPSDPAAFVKGTDPQLDKGVEVLLSELAKHPINRGVEPPAKDRVKNGGN